jgi:hypothetical protein
MEQNVTEAEYVMREILKDEITMGYEQESVFLHMIPPGGFVHQRGAEWLINLEANPDARAYGDGGKVPRGSNTVKRKHKVTYARHAISRIVTDDVLLTDRKSIVKGLGPMVAEDTDTLLKDLNRACFGNGSYELATVEAAPAGTLAVTMKKPFRGRKLDHRRVVNIVDPATFAKRTATIGGVPTSEFYVVSQNPDIATGVIELADAESDGAADVISATTIVANDLVVPADSGGLALKGLSYHINDDSGLYQNLSRGTWPKQLVPPVKDMQNQDISPAELDLLESRITFKKGTKHSLDDLVYVSAVTQQFGYKRQGYNTDVKIVRQWSGNDKTFDQGWKVVTHNGRTWVLDNDCSPSDLFMAKRSTFKKYEIKKIGLVDTDGRTLRMIPAVDSSGNGTYTMKYQYTVNWLGDIANENILENARMKNLNTEGLPTGLAA